MSYVDDDRLMFLKGEFHCMPEEEYQRKFKDFFLKADNIYKLKGGIKT